MLTRLNHLVKQRLRPFMRQEAHAEVEDLRADLEAQTGELFHVLRDLSRQEARHELQRSPLISAKTLPFAADAPDVFSLPLDRPAAAADEPLPIPPPELWTVTEHFLDGVHDVEAMFGSLQGAGMDLEPLDRVLEVGCGPARLLRHLRDHARDHEVWGVDIDAQAIAWNKQHLTPPFRFCSVTTAPHLPFEDNSFDLVFAVSVFTHLSELADAWLLEMRRVTRPGGYLYVTIQDQRWLDALEARPPEQRDWLNDVVDAHEAELAALGVAASVVCIDRGSPVAMVIHDRASLVRSWSAYVDVVAVTDHGSHTQSGVVLRKRTA